MILILAHLYNVIQLPCIHYPSSLSPDDHSRVVLSVPDSTGNDYINASFIDVSGICTSRYIYIICIRRHVRMYEGLYLHVHAHTYIAQTQHLHAHTLVNYCIHIHIVRACICTHPHKPVHTHITVYVHVYTQTNTYIFHYNSMYMYVKYVHYF